MKEKIGLVVSLSTLLFTVCFQLVILREYIRYKDVYDVEQIPMEKVRELKISEELLTDLIDKGKKGEIDFSQLKEKQQKALENQRNMPTR